MLTDHDIDLGQAALAAGLIDARQLAQAYHAAGHHGIDLPFSAVLIRAGLAPDAVRNLEAELLGVPLSHRDTLALYSDVSAPPRIVSPPSDRLPLPPAVAAPAGTASDRLGLPAERFAARFVSTDELGRGGVGRVMAADDTLIGRSVAIKLLLTREATQEQVQRFITEAQTTAQLEHPNVVPVYDFSMLENGAPCFVMRRVRGRSLLTVLRGLADQEPAVVEEFTRFRLLQIFINVCQAVEYAHSKGVIHRDLKPDNIMLGHFGEVLVMDWGIAKILGQADSLDAVQPSLSAGLPGTLEGSIVGTPGYMAPEQARGHHEQIEPRTDVWALGAILYEMLSGTYPFANAGNAIAMLVATATRAVPAVQTIAPDRDIPDELAEICARALAADVQDRFAAVKPLREAIEAFLAGTREAARRAEEADRQLRDGEESLWYMRMLREELIELRDRLTQQPPLTGTEPLDTKRARWATEDRASAIRKELHRAFDWAQSKFTRAVELVPTLDAPRTLLADMHWRQYRDALDAFDHAAAEDHLKAVTRYRPADPRLRRPTLRLHTTPAGAQVTLLRVVERDRLLIDTAPRSLGHTPLDAVTLPTGRSVLIIEAPDRRPVRLPILAWQGDQLDFTVHIPTDAALGADFVFIPGGTYVRGGDPEALLSKPAQVIDVAPFAIQRLPVTCGAYFDYLDAIPTDEAHRRAPRINGQPYVQPGPEGRYSRPLIDVDGDTWHPDWPIFSISFDDARAYCAWASARDGVAYRLPTEDEWEKAARGPDGRFFPWGDHFDPTFTRMRYSLPGDLMPKPVGQFEADASPYGVRDLAGNVREWTDGWIEEGLRTVRGGAFNHYAFTCRAASRFGYTPRRTLAGVGFRMVKPLAEEGAEEGAKTGAG